MVLPTVMSERRASASATGERGVLGADARPVCAGADAVSAGCVADGGDGGNWVSPWSVRLKALVPTWQPCARKRLALTDETEAQRRAISPRQIDSVLAPDKHRLRRRQYRGTRPGTLLKHRILIKTDHWDVTEPGFTEVDVVSHSGDPAKVATLCRHRDTLDPFALAARIEAQLQHLAPTGLCPPWAEDRRQ